MVLGGPEPPHYAEEYLAAGADIVAIGEGELTLEELIPHLAQHGMADLQEIRGIVYRDDDGEIVNTGPRPQIPDLGAQPWPDREAIDLERYLETWHTHHGVRSVSLITARGCPYTCTWCSHSVFGETHRRRSVEDVVDEVAWLAEHYQPDQLWYADDVFTINRRWFLQYAEALKARGLRIPFECISRADRIDEAVADALAEMGCYRLWIGAESGSQRILDAMKRKADIADVQAKTKLLQARGIQVGMFIMLGYDGEDVSDIEATVDHLKTSNPDVFLTTVAYPIKGTKYHEAVADQVYSGLHWDQRTDRDLGVQGRYSAEFYDHATRWMVSEVTLHRLRQAGSRDFPRIGAADGQRPARPPRHAPHRASARRRQRPRPRRPRLGSRTARDGSVVTAMPSPLPRLSRQAAEFPTVPTSSPQFPPPIPSTRPPAPMTPTSPARNWRAGCGRRCGPFLVRRLRRATMCWSWAAAPARMRSGWPNAASTSPPPTPRCRCWTSPAAKLKPPASARTSTSCNSTSPPPVLTVYRLLITFPPSPAPSPTSAR